MSEKEEENAPGAKAAAEIQIFPSNLSCVDFVSFLESLGWEELLQLQQQHADVKRQKHRGSTTSLSWDNPTMDPSHYHPSAFPTTFH